MERTERFKAGAGKILALLRKAMRSEAWMAGETLVAALFFLFGAEVAGVVFFVYLIAFKMMVSDDTLSGFLPFLLIGLIVLRLYDSFDRFMALKFVMGVPAVVGLLFHFIFYRKKPQKGGLTKGYFAVAVALALGGLFSLPMAHYLSGTSLYYTYGLGFGLLFLYSILRGNVDPHGDYDLKDYVAKTAFYVALLAVFIIAVQYLGNLSEIKEGGWDFSERRLSSISNNLSTTVLLTMPFLFYLSRKGGVRGAVSFLVGVLEGLAAVLSLSRGGMIFAGAMCVFLVGYTLVADKAGRLRNAIIVAAVAVLSVTVVLLCRDTFAVLYGEGIKDSGTTVKVIFFGLAFGTIAVTTYALYLFRMRDKRKRRAHLAILCSLAVVGLALFIVKFDDLKPLLVKADYYRGNMMIVAAKNFRVYPIFGTGMGYRGLRSIYQNKEGMFGCYHCLPVQVVGSLGLFGVAAYLFMFRERLATLQRGRNTEFSVAVFLSYLGLLWISMVNPGIFCPVVYGLQIAVYFIAAERADENTDISGK